MLEVKFKKLVPEAKIPAYAKSGDAGLDLTATSKHWSDDFQCWIYGTGLAVEIPNGYVGLIFPRSSVRKYGLALTNCVGVVDSGYRGEVMCTFRPQSKGTDEVYKVGDKVCQLIIMPYPQIMPVEATELSETERGENGHGSTGRYYYNKVLIDFFEKNPKYNNILTHRIMNDYIKTLIEANKDAVSNIVVLEATVRDYLVTDEKSKTNFGNLCILLNGYRNVAKATDCLLINENVLKDAEGNYYQKIEEDVIVPPTTEGKPGSDFDIDKEKQR